MKLSLGKPIGEKIEIDRENIVLGFDFKLTEFGWDGESTRTGTWWR